MDAVTLALLKALGGGSGGSGSTIVYLSSTIDTENYQITLSQEAKTELFNNAWEHINKNDHIVLLVNVGNNNFGSYSLLWNGTIDKEPDAGPTALGHPRFQTLPFLFDATSEEVAVEVRFSETSYIASVITYAGQK